jgi:hypothetical protein
MKKMQPVVAYWAKDDGTEALYEIMMAPARMTRRDYAAYQAACYQVAEISRTLKPEGYKLHYRAAIAKAEGVKENA